MSALSRLLQPLLKERPRLVKVSLERADVADVVQGERHIAVILRLFPPVQRLVVKDARLIGLPHPREGDADAVGGPRRLIGVAGPGEVLPRLAELSRGGGEVALDAVASG